LPLTRLPYLLLFQVVSLFSPLLFAFWHLKTATKTWSDEIIVYGSKNSILVDTINYTNEFNKENKQKAKEQEEEKALAKEPSKKGE
jgi:hypothetical protein